MNAAAAHRSGSLAIGAAIVLALLVPGVAHAQVGVVAQPNHELLLASPDPRIAANKRFVYDFWRDVFEAGQMELPAEHRDSAPKL